MNNCPPNCEHCNRDQAEELAERSEILERDEDEQDEVLSDCCGAIIYNGFCSDCKEHA